MGKKRKHSEAEVAVTVKKDESAEERPKRTLLGWKDKDKIEEKVTDSTVFRNKEKVLVTCSRRINYRYRHLMLNVVSLLPHCKKDNKVESKASKGATLNELVELKGCSSCLFFECRKHKDLYLWMAKCPNGPSVKFLVNAVHTMEELKLTGNHLKGSRPLLTFSTNFDKDPHWKLLKEIIMQIFGTPKDHRKSKPYHDHIFVFSIVDDHIWFRNYQGALVGSYKGSCHLYNTSENKLQQKGQINLQNKKKKSHHKKITGFQFAPGSSSEVLITSADSRIRVIEGVDLVHKFKGFRNTNSQISASLTANGNYVVSASEDSHVYVWKHEGNSQPSRSKGVTVTRSYEHFHCQDVSMAIPWPGMCDSWGFQDRSSGEQSRLGDDLDAVSTANHPPTPVEEINGNESTLLASACPTSPLHGTISSATNSYFFDRISATWPEEKLLLTAKNRSPRVSVDFSNSINQSRSAWGMVIVTAGLRGEIRTFQNFGLPVRI